MEIRTLLPEEFDAQIKLSQYAFQYDLSPEEMDRARLQFKPEQIYAVVDNGHILSMARVIPLEIYWNGNILKMGGVASVASWPEGRRKGQVGELLRHALVQMKENGETVSMLAPFSIPFYRKFGWELTFDAVKYTITKDKLPPRLGTSGGVERICPQTDSSAMAVIQELYETYASKFNGSLKRSAEWWGQQVFRRKKGDTALYRTQDGIPAGYALYQAKDKQLVVHELVYLTEEARRGLWTFFSNHDSMIERAVFQSYAGDPLPYQLPDPRIEQTILPYFMVRIVDLPAFVGKCSFLPGAAECYELEVEDEHAPWNKGRWVLRMDESGGATLQPAEGEASDKVIRADIKAFAALFIGYKGARELGRIEALNGPAAETAKLEQRIPRTAANLMDYF